MSINDEKGALRHTFIELLKGQKEQERLRKSQEIARKFFELKGIQAARTILFYASFGGEVDTFAMMERALQLRKRVALPSIVRDQKRMIPTLTDNLQDIESGPYNIRQPRLDASKAIIADEIDAVVVPALAFDKANQRLGRGAGYYDRFLADLPATTQTYGIAFDFQIVESLPTEPHDVAVHHIIAG